MQFDDEDLELAFQLYVVQRVVAADQITTTREQGFLDAHFPAADLRDRGFQDDEHDRTPRFHQAVAEALAVLPGRLSRPAKHDLLEAVYRLAVVDDEFRLGEGHVLLEASRLLGLSDVDFNRFLTGRPAAAGMSAEALDDP